MKYNVRESELAESIYKLLKPATQSYYSQKQAKEAAYIGYLNPSTGDFTLEREDSSELQKSWIPKNSRTETECKKSKELLEQSLAQSALLQKDIDANNRQLKEAQQLNESRGTFLTALTESNPQLQNRLDILESSTLKENEQLKTRIQHLEQGLHLIGTAANPQESKTASSESILSPISKKELYKILKKNNCKANPGIFSCTSANDASLICLQTKLKIKKNDFTYQEIKDCVQNHDV